MILSFVQPRLIFSTLSTVSTRFREIINKPSFSFFLFARVWRLDPLKPFPTSELKSLNAKQVKLILRQCGLKVSGKKNELLKRLIKHLLEIKEKPKTPAGIKARHVLIQAKIRLKLARGCDYCGDNSKREFSEFHRIFLCKGCRFVNTFKLCTPHHSLTYYGVTVKDAAQFGFSVKDVHDRDFKWQVLERTNFILHDDVVHIAARKWGSFFKRRNREDILALKRRARLRGEDENDALASSAYSEL